VGLVSARRRLLVLPDLSLFWVVFFVLVLSVILDRLLFRPVLHVIKQREAAATSARKLAEQAAAEARKATEEFDRKTAEARAEVYRQMDEMRREALAERAGLPWLKVRKHFGHRFTLAGDRPLAK
jgi:F-type H+-transporting ATPase subunit b